MLYATEISLIVLIFLLQNYEGYPEGNLRFGVAR